MSALVVAGDNAGTDGAADGLTGNELLFTVFLLVTAGFDTTVNLIASGTLALLAHPEEKTRLRQDPSLHLGRDTSGHVAFGHGIHYCLGAPPARMEAEVAPGAVLSRFPGLSLAVSPSELRWRPVSLMNGLEFLPSVSPDRHLLGGRDGIGRGRGRC